MELVRVNDQYNRTTIPVANPADLNEINVRRIIRREENPSPVIITAIIIITLILTYYLYIFTIKECYNGAWYSSINDEQFIINHNKWNDAIYISRNGVYFMKGYISGNSIIVHQISNESILYIGTIYNNIIYWTASKDIWMRPVDIL